MPWGTEAPSSKITTLSVAVMKSSLTAPPGAGWVAKATCMASGVLVEVERSDAATAGDAAGGRVEPRGDEGREPPDANLLIEIGQLAGQVVDDAAGADRVDAGEEDEAAVAVRTGLSRQVGDITGRLRGIVARRMVGVAGALVGQEPAAVVAFELQHGVGLEHFGDERGDARAADHHEVVAVEVHIAPELDVLDLGAELEVAGEVCQGVEGGEVFLGDCGPAVLGLALERNGDGQGVEAEEGSFGWWPGLTELGMRARLTPMMSAISASERPCSRSRQCFRAGASMSR